MKRISRFMEGVGNIVEATINDEVASIVTTVGTFAFTTMRNKLVRTVSFTIGQNPTDNWMEEALYAVIYLYNPDISKRNIQLSTIENVTMPEIYYRLEDGFHRLKYRDYDIMLSVETLGEPKTYRRDLLRKRYTIITFNLDTKFVSQFEADLVRERNHLFKIKGAKNINVWRDVHEQDGTTYWYSVPAISKRPMKTIYLDKETKTTLINTVNRFFSEREFYKKHGMAHNLKILLHGPTAPQPHRTLIPTPEGLRRFGSLCVGDIVFNRLGKPVTVLRVKEEGDLDTYEVTFHDGRTTLCADTHLWPILNAQGGIIQQSTLSLLNQGLLNEDGKYKFAIPSNQGVEFKEKDLPIDPWSLGILITKGLNRKTLTIATEDASIANRIARVHNFTVKGTETDSGIEWEFYSSSSHEPISAKDFYEEFAEGVDNGELPESYWINSKKNRTQFLEGLFGVNIPLDQCLGLRKDFFRNGHLGVSIRRIQTTLQSLGYLGLLAAPTGDHGDGSIVISKGEVLRIVKISKLCGKSPMRCITVEDPEHLYLTSNFIPTCNSGKESIAKAIASEWNRHIYYVSGGNKGRFVPEALTANAIDPLFVVSDIDRYPFLINDADDADEEARSRQLEYLEGNKFLFGKMLNALDGIISGENRIIIITTNHIDKFSPTFLRPGRMDLILELKRVVPEVFRKFTYDFFGKVLPKKIELSRDDISIAEMQADIRFMRISYENFLKKYTKSK